MDMASERRNPNWHSIVKVLLVVIIFVALLFLTDFVIALFIASLVACLMIKIDNKIPLAAALVLLVACPLLLILGLGSTANAFADVAFYLFTIGIALQLSQYFRTCRADPGETGSKVR
jgi:predicted PurR-regulated permease PerM